MRFPIMLSREASLTIYTSASPSQQPSIMPDPIGSPVVFASTLPVGVIACIVITCTAVLGLFIGGSYYYWTEYRKRQRGDVEGQIVVKRQSAASTDAYPIEKTTAGNIVRDASRRSVADDAYVHSGGLGSEAWDCEDEELHGETRQWTLSGELTMRQSEAPRALGTMSIRR